jgi:hypothetical protein
LNLIQAAASTTKKMQKYLRLMNFRLDVVVRDVTGLTGLLIIDAICKGEKDPEVLSQLRHGNCRKSKEEIARALNSNGREDYLFALTQEYELFQILQNKISACDVEIEKVINEQIATSDTKSSLYIESKPHKRVNKNSPQNIDLNLKSYQYFEGIDLMAIEGVSHSTIMAVMSEIGSSGFKKFSTAKQFTSWLRLSPNPKISGGKVLSSKIPKGSNRLKIAFRNTANAIGNLKNTHLSDFFNRINFRRGRHAAVSATARKLAVIIWNMIVKSVAYNPPTEYEYLDQKRKRKVKEMQKHILKLGIKANDFTFVTN